VSHTTHTAVSSSVTRDAVQDCHGQTARYLGTLEGHPHFFELEDHHCFETGRPMPVCGDTAAMLSETRLADHFVIDGDRAVHYGLFDCALPGADSSGTTKADGCC
jgi:hypothetical protein